MKHLHKYTDNDFYATATSTQTAENDQTRKMNGTENNAIATVIATTEHFKAQRIDLW